MASTELKIVFSSVDKVNTGSIQRKFSELREMGEKVSNLGTKISAVFTLPIVGLGALLLKNEELAKSLQPIKDEFEKVVASLAQGLIPVIKDITPAILNIVKGIGDLVKQFNALSVEQKENILKWVGIVAAIGPAIFIIGQIINFVGTLGVVVTQVTPVISGFFKAIGVGSKAAFGELILLVGAIKFLIDLWNSQEADATKQFLSVAWGNFGASLTGNNDPTQRAIWTMDAYNKMGGGKNKSIFEGGGPITTTASLPPAYVTNVANVNYSPTISTADQAQVKQTLTPIIQDAMRSFVPTR